MLSVFLFHHLNENQKYLDAAIEGLRTQKDIEFEVVCLADTESKPLVPDWVRLYHDRELINSTKKLNFGIAHSDPRSDCYLMHADDVVMSETSLAKLYNFASQNEVIVNPLSNNDNGFHFITQLPVGNSCDYSDYLVRWAKEQGGKDIFIPVPWIPFYCTMFQKKVWEKVGGLDENLEVRYNDVDFCYRAAALGIKTMINLGAFALHFGSKTLPKVTSEAEYKAADDHFKNKYKLV